MAGPVGSMAAGVAASAAALGRGDKSPSGSGTGSPDSVREDDETPDWGGGTGVDKSRDGADCDEELWDEEAWAHIVTANADRANENPIVRKLKRTARIHCMVTF